MLAALDRPETRVCHGNLSGLRQIPTPVFRAAFRELAARIWIELELLAQAAGRIEQHGPPRDITTCAAILRLELVVLVDSCRSAHWRCMLSVEQRDILCSLLTDVLAALYVDSEHLSDAITAAQDRVFDELLTEPGTLLHLAGRESVCEPGQGSSPATNSSG